MSVCKNVLVPKRAIVRLSVFAHVSVCVWPFAGIASDRASVPAPTLAPAPVPVQATEPVSARAFVSASALWLWLSVHPRVRLPLSSR